MRNKISKTFAAAMVLVLSQVTLPTQAASGVGKAIISIGKVSTTNKDGVKAKLKRRGKVFEGDTITVGKKSRLQLRFIDNQLVILKANTVFRIDEYKFKDKNDNNKSAALSLLKGGMRSVTGLIGKSARDKYKVKTPVATMGVRGTHYVIQICSGDCGDGVKGIVGTVLEGSIVMTNDAGTQEFGTDQFFNVPSGNEAPKAITNPPRVLISRAETGSDDEEAEETTTTAEDSTTVVFSSTEEETLTTTTGDVAGTPVTFILGTPAPFNAGLVVAGIASGVDGAGGASGVEGSNALIDIATVGGIANQPVSSIIIDAFGTVEFQVKTGAVATETGGDGVLGINWGRWGANDIVFQDNGTDQTLDADVGLAFAYSPNLTDPATLSAFFGTAVYDLVNGPNILDESGGIVTGSVSMGVDFDMSSITSFGGTLTGSGRTYVVSLDNITPLSVLLGGGQLDISSTCGSCPGGITSLTGSAGGVFVGINAEALIGYFGLNSADGTVGVSGVGVGNGVGSFGFGGQ